MTEGGWRSFREASKHKAIAATAAEELDRPAVSHRVLLQPPFESVLEVHGAAPEIVPELPDSDKPVEPDEDPAAEDQDPDKLFEQAMALMTPAWPVKALTPPSRLRRAMSPLAPLKQHWYVAAIVPVAAAASLLAVWAGVNPYALCLQWWDFLYGSIFLTASLLFIGLAIWKGPRGAWHPGAPALAVVIGVIPFWVATNVAFGTVCAEPMAAVPSSLMLPPLPPPIEVPSRWAVPMPMARPPELQHDFLPQQLDLRTTDDVQIKPPRL